MRHTYDFLGNHAMPNPRAMFYFKGLKLKTSILTIAMPKPRAQIKLLSHFNSASNYGIKQTKIYRLSSHWIEEHTNT